MRLVRAADSAESSGRGVRLPSTGVGATGGGGALGGVDPGEECKRASPPRLTTTCAGSTPAGSVDSSTWRLIR